MLRKKSGCLALAVLSMRLNGERIGSRWDDAPGSSRECSSGRKPLKRLPHGRLLSRFHIFPSARMEGREDFIGAGEGDDLGAVAMELAARQRPHRHVIGQRIEIGAGAAGSGKATATGARVNCKAPDNCSASFALSISITFLACAYGVVSPRCRSDLKMHA